MDEEKSQVSMHLDNYFQKYRVFSPCFSEMNSDLCISSDSNAVELQIHIGRYYPTIILILLVNNNYRLPLKAAMMDSCREERYG